MAQQTDPKIMRQSIKAYTREMNGHLATLAKLGGNSHCGAGCPCGRPPYAVEDVAAVLGEQDAMEYAALLLGERI